ncbi:MAG TPA: S8 family serine peptidase [Flavipsychrobacter sp.]
MMRLACNICLLIFLTTIHTQSSAQDMWHLQQPVPGKVFGIDIYNAYRQVKDKQPEPVVVAVIDNGTQISHPALQPYLWVNKGEIAGNNNDDDGNGYIDDIHGWNYLGGTSADISYAALEVTRHYQALKKKYPDTAGLTEEQIDELEEATARFEEIERQWKSTAKLANKMYDKRDKFLMRNILKLTIGKNADEELTEMKEVADEMVRMNTINTDSMRRAIVGDNPDDPAESQYGNNHLAAGDPAHGTHTAGIIMNIAKQDNYKGDWLKVITLRSVPVYGDERDKDVANAIRYAVDNGVKVINMSFGKELSPHRQEVIAAIQYAREKDVLLVHGAGNDGRQIDSLYTRNFPNPWLDSLTYADNWIEVGASTNNRKKLVASFSNYGRKSVDILAPGHNIYSTYPPDTFRAMSGTSMAAPVVAGVAAAIRSYYPRLSAPQVKEILMKTVVRHQGYYPVGGNKKLVAELWYFSRAGGIINANKAFAEAEKVAAVSK